LRAYIQLAKLRLLTALTYRFDVYAGVFTNLILMLATVFLWKTAYRGLGQVGGVSREQMITYAIVSALLGSLFVARVDDEINEKIRRGDIAVDFIRPIHPLLAWLADDIGSSIASFLMQFVPLLIFSAVFIRFPLPANAAAAALFIPCCVLSFSILWLLSALCGLIAFWTMDLGELGIAKDAVVRVLSGGLVPLWFFPPWAQKISACLPFQYAVQQPLAIYIGKAGPREAVAGILIQVAWVAVLGAAVVWLWKRGQRRVLVQGG